MKAAVIHILKCFILRDRNKYSFDGDLAYFMQKGDEDRLFWLLFSFFIVLVKSTEGIAYQH